MPTDPNPEVLSAGLAAAPGLLLDALPLAVYTTDPAGRITYHNPAAAALWGGPPAPDARFDGAWQLRTKDGSPLDPAEGPMATCLRTGLPVRGHEAVAIHPDGTAVAFLAYPTPLLDAEGTLTGGINLLVEATDRSDRERLAAIVSSSNDAILSKTLDGVITSWNDGATRIFGYSAQEMIGTPITRIIPPELHSEERGILARLRQGERIEHFDTVRLGRDGRRIDISLTISPLRDAAGTIVGASKVARDITERKRNEDLQSRLFDELNHRVKNTLATIQAIAGQSLRRAASPEAFVAGFTGRVQALAGVHDLLVQGQLRGAELAPLIRDRIGDVPAGRLTLSGPPVVVPPAEAVQLALVLNELASNARQHGAFATGSGRLAVSWSLAPGPRSRLNLVWRESGTPARGAPAAPRLGIPLIERSLDSSGGSATLHFSTGGLTCEIDLPLSTADTISDRPGIRPDETPARPDALVRVLIVEDEALVALDIESQLVAAGYAVIGPAATLDAARTLIATTEFEVALVDANLAGRTVEDLAAALSDRAIPFAFATGYGREALPPAFRQAPLLSKPFTERQLFAILDTLLSR